MTRKLLKIMFVSLMVLFISVFSVYTLIKNNEEFDGINFGENFKLAYGIDELGKGIFVLDYDETKVFDIEIPEINKLILEGDTKIIEINESADSKLYIEIFGDDLAKETEVIFEENTATGEGELLLNKGKSGNILAYKISIPTQIKDIYATVKNVHYEVEDVSTSFVAVSKNASFEIARLTGDITLDAKNANYEIENIEGNVEIYGKNSKIEIEDISGDVTIENTNGKIEINEILGDADITLSNGKIEYSIEYLENDLRLITTNGKVEIDLGASENYSLDASTSNGKVENNLKLNNIDLSSRSRVKGVNGTPDKKIVIENSNGKVELN